MKEFAKAPKATESPDLLDRVIGELQEALVGELGWLDHAFGRAERVVKSVRGRRFYIPTVYAGGEEYADVSPDSGLGCFCFFFAEDPQEVEWEAKVSVGINATVSVIFWLDYRKVHGSLTVRDREGVKRQILDALNRATLRSGRIRVRRVYELAENIYRGFSLDEIDNQYLMHPFGGFRFECRVEVSEKCLQ